MNLQEETVVAVLVSNAEPIRQALGTSASTTSDSETSVFSACPAVALAKEGGLL
jgi:hypothetical protein